MLADRAAVENEGVEEREEARDAAEHGSGSWKRRGTCALSLQALPCAPLRVLLALGEERSDRCEHAAGGELAREAQPHLHQPLHRPHLPPPPSASGTLRHVRWEPTRSRAACVELASAPRPPPPSAMHCSAMATSAPSCASCRRSASLRDMWRASSVTAAAYSPASPTCTVSAGTGLKVWGRARTRAAEQRGERCAEGVVEVVGAEGREELRQLRAEASAVRLEARASRCHAAALRGLLPRKPRPQVRLPSLFCHALQAFCQPRQSHAR